MATIVCADTERQCRAVAQLGPSIMICEPTASIGTGTMDAGDYIERTTRAVKEIDPSILVIQAAGRHLGRRHHPRPGAGCGRLRRHQRHRVRPDWRAVLVDMFSRSSRSETRPAEKEPANDHRTRLKRSPTQPAPHRPRRREHSLLRGPPRHHRRG